MLSRNATRGGETLVSSDYTEAHDFCLRDGSKVVATETGMLQLWCVARDGRRWKLEFNVRERV